MKIEEGMFDEDNIKINGMPVILIGRHFCEFCELETEWVKNEDTEEKMCSVCKNTIVQLYPDEISDTEFDDDLE